MEDEEIETMCYEEQEQEEEEEDERSTKKNNVVLENIKRPPRPPAPPPAASTCPDTLAADETNDFVYFAQDENNKMDDDSEGFGDFPLQPSTNASRSIWDDLLSGTAGVDIDPPLSGFDTGTAVEGFEFDNNFDASTPWPAVNNSADPPNPPEETGDEVNADGRDWETVGSNSTADWPDVRNSPDGKEADTRRIPEDDPEEKGEKDGRSEVDPSTDGGSWSGFNFEGVADDGGTKAGPGSRTGVKGCEEKDDNPFEFSSTGAETDHGYVEGKMTTSGLDSSENFDFDPRSDLPIDQILAAQSASSSSSRTSSAAQGGSARARPRPQTTSKPTNPFNIALREAPPVWDMEDDDDAAAAASGGGGTHGMDPFNFDADMLLEPSEKNNPFAAAGDSDLETMKDGGIYSEEWNAFPVDRSSSQQQGNSESEFNPFATITDEEGGGGGAGGGRSGGGTGGGGGGGEEGLFDPFQTIHDDDAFVLPGTGRGGTREPEVLDPDDPNVSPSRFNPFDKEPPLPDQFASLTPVVRSADDLQSPKVTSSENSLDEPELENPEPLEPFYPKWDSDGGWNLLLRQPFKKKLTQNRFWKPAFVRLMVVNDNPVCRVYANDKDQECLHELAVQPTFTLCEMGLQQLDQFGKCHTVKIQQVSYKESVGLKSERIAPTISDLTRVRDFKSLKDLVHKPKATMILDHAPHATEVLKFGGLNYKDFKNFIHGMEDLLFRQKSIRGKSAAYTKDEITVDVQDEYYAEIDKDGHIVDHKARVRLFCLAFLSESPIVEVGINDKRRRGREVVGRRDIIPIKTEEWIRTEDSELHSIVEVAEFEKTKVIRYNPLDACHFELMRFRVRPRPNLELPLQIRVQMSVVERHIEVRIEVMVTGYYSNSRRAAQTPCEDIQIRFPVPESWIYLFRVERRFKYGAIHSSTRKPGKIKGLERLTMFAQGILPASLIEVSAGLAKYENAFQAVVWRIDQLPERNEGAYKTHLMVINLDLAAHDKMPDELDKYVHVEYSMANSTVSRAQVRSIAISGVDEPPDRWVRHLAKYEYTLEIEFTDKLKAQSEDLLAPVTSTPPAAATEDDQGVAPTAVAEDDSGGSSSDSD